MPKYLTRSSTNTGKTTSATQQPTTKYRWRPTIERRTKNYQKPYKPYHPFQLGDGVQVLHKYIDPKTNQDHWGLLGTIDRITEHYCFIATEHFDNDTIIEGPIYRKHRKYLHPFKIKPYHLRLEQYREHERFVKELEAQIAARNSTP